MNTTLMIFFLLLPCFPAFVEAWNAEDILPQTVLNPAEHPFCPMDNAELQKQAALLETISDPAVRSRIVFDIGNCCNPNVFAVLGKALANEKEPSVRADIITAMANIATTPERPANRPCIEIRRQPAYPCELEKSAASSYLPEQLAAKRLLKLEQVPTLTDPEQDDPITKKQKYYNAMRKNPASANVKELLAVIDSREHPLVRLEAIRALNEHKPLSSAAVRKLKKIAAENYVRLDKKTSVHDQDAVRAAAYFVLYKCDRSSAKEAGAKMKRDRSRLLQEYLRQIEGDGIPAPLPRTGGDRTIRFVK